MQMDNKLVVIRTDASLQIGSGHVMRCLTLAEALWKSGAEVQFVCRGHSGNLIELIRQKEFIVHDLLVPENFESACVSENNLENEYESWLGTSQEQDAQETITVIQKNNPEWLIVDHYAMGQAWESQLRPHVRNIMVIDDLANRSHDCDLLLDQNYFQDGDSRYNGLVPPTCTKLLGPQFALIRPEFAEARKHVKPRTGKVQRVFVFFGGSDPDNITGKALETLSFPEFSRLDVDVVIGSYNSLHAKIAKQVEMRPSTSLHVQIENMAELMAQADLSLGAGGATTWERLCLGLPSLVVTIAKNQIPLTESLHQDGYIRWLGNSELVNEQTIQNGLLEAIKNPHQLREQSTKRDHLVDGMGVNLVSDLLNNGPNPETLVARRAIFSDSILYWHWANDPVVRENAFNQEMIEWEDHQIWFDRHSSDSDTILLLIECEVGPVGQVRFDKSDTHYTVNYSLTKQFRGFGLGKVILEKAIIYLKKEHSFTLIGDVKESNPSSQKIFEKIGFSEAPSPRAHVRRFQLQFSPTVQHG
jgi:UDP-2,4-diacetamido-2,4,6-trideoxy-beta-L-altropyranose hydrolase